VHQHVAINVRDYERLRLDSSRFVVCEGHEAGRHRSASTERTPEYLVVEKGWTDAPRRSSGGPAGRPDP
jgi:hypothetical protein